MVLLDHVKTLYLYYRNKIGRVLTYNEELPNHKVLWSFIHLILQSHVTNQTFYISNCTRSMATKQDKVVTYRDEIPPINSHNPFNRWSRVVMWQI